MERKKSGETNWKKQEETGEKKTGQKILKKLENKTRRNKKKWEETGRT